MTLVESRGSRVESRTAAAPHGPYDWFLLLLLVAIIMLTNEVMAVAAQHTTENFTAAHASADVARQVAEAAEEARARLAERWLGHTLPPWSERCPIAVQVGPLGAGGATTFSFDRGEVFGWKMRVQGTLERVLDSVIPHEVNHTIFATHFRRPLPRWYDEGASDTVEHPVERARQRQILAQEWNRRYRMADLFDVAEYPSDPHKIMALYSQGASVSSYLLSLHDPPTFLAFGETAHADGWNDALQKHYGIRNVNELEADWIKWVTAKPDTTKPNRVTAAAISPDKPDLVVFVATGCLYCEPVKEDVQQGAYDAWNVIFVEWDSRAGRWNTPWVYVDGRKALHTELDGGKLLADFQQKTSAGQPLKVPHVWVRYTEHHYAVSTGVTGLRAWLRGILATIKRAIVGEPAPLPAGQLSTPFAAPDPSATYERSQDSRVDGLLDTVAQLKADLVAAANTAKAAKEEAGKFSEAGLIGKARAGLALKSDVTELKTRVESARDHFTELKAGLKDPAALLQLGWGVLGWLYRRRKAA